MTGKKLNGWLGDQAFLLRARAVRMRNWQYRATRRSGRPFRAVEHRIFPDGLGNWRRRRFAETGRGFVAERATRRLRSSAPVYRNRINPATGRPRRDDAEVYRRRDEAFARMRERGTIPARKRARTR